MASMTQTQTDDAALIKLEAFWPYQAVVLADLVSRHTHALLKARSDLNLSQWRVLAAIGEAPGRSSAEVVAVTPMDKGLVSRAVALLLEAGLIMRRPDPSDKRRASLHLSASGKRAYEQISNDLLNSLSTIPSAQAKTLSKELEVMIKALRGVRP